MTIELINGMTIKGAALTYSGENRILDAVKPYILYSYPEKDWYQIGMRTEEELIEECKKYLRKIGAKPGTANYSTEGYIFDGPQ